MKTTRNIFVLTGKVPVIKRVLRQLDFKGITTIHSQNISEAEILSVFSNNKSVLCYTNPPRWFNNCIYIYIDSHLKFNINCDYIDISIGNISKQFSQIADKYNCDIGDVRSNSSKVTNNNCCYCNILNGILGDNKKIIYQSSNFFVIPTLGQFICGYLLIIPIEHVMSNAELSPSIMEEFNSVLADIEFLLSLTYHTNDFLVWENGTASSGKSKAADSVVHAHTHIAPSSLNADIIRDISELDFNTISLESLCEYGSNSYLLLKSHDGSYLINSNPNVYIPRQYIRQILAEEKNIPDLENCSWNWRTHPFYHLMDQTNLDLSKAIEQHWNELPERIKNNVRI